MPLLRYVYGGFDGSICFSIVCYVVYFFISNKKLETNSVCFELQGLIEIPYILVQTLVYGLITYSMIQFEWTAGNYNSSLGNLFKS